MELSGAERASTVQADVVAREVAVDERLEPGIGLLAELDDRGAAYLAVRPQSHRHPYRAVDRVVGEKDRRADETSLIVTAEIEPVEVLGGRPSRTLQGLALLGREPDLADEEASRSREEAGDRLAVGD